MLIDDVISRMYETEVSITHDDLRKEALPMVSAIVKMLTTAQAFVLSPHVVDAAYDMHDIDAVRASLSHLFLPALRTWIEWDDSDGDDRLFGQGKHGVLIEGNDIYSGNIYAYNRSNTSPMWVWSAVFDFRDGGGMKFDGGKVLVDPNSLKGLEPILMSWVWTILAIINTPRVSEQRPVDLSRLNKSRGTRPPLIQYKEVRLTVDAALCKPNRTTGAVPTGEKARHHVRTHMRLRNGKVQIVKPHWRGNRDKGIIKHRHMVQMSDDEHGLWEGGPLPPPIVLKPKQDA